MRGGELATVGLGAIRTLQAAVAVFPRFAAHSHARLRRGRVRPAIVEPVLTGLLQRGFSHPELKQAAQGR